MQSSNGSKINKKRDRGRARVGYEEEEDHVPYADGFEIVH